MMEPSFSLQTAVRARLIASPELIELVPADQILDRHGRPEADRLIIIGTGNTLYSDDYSSFADTATLDVHVWVREPDFSACKTIAHLVRVALKNPPWSAPGYMVHGLTATARWMRDPDQEFAHGVIGLSATMKALAA